jgi:hypothetical protein
MKKKLLIGLMFFGLSTQNQTQAMPSFSGFAKSAWSGVRFELTKAGISGLSNCKNYIFTNTDLKQKVFLAGLLLTIRSWASRDKKIKSLLETTNYLASKTAINAGMGYLEATNKCTWFTNWVEKDLIAGVLGSFASQCDEDPEQNIAIKNRDLKYLVSFVSSALIAHAAFSCTKHGKLKSEGLRSQFTGKWNLFSRLLLPLMLPRIEPFLNKHAPKVLPFCNAYTPENLKQFIKLQMA